MGILEAIQNLFSGNSGNNNNNKHVDNPHKATQNTWNGSSSSSSSDNSNENVSNPRGKTYNKQDFLKKLNEGTGQLSDDEYAELKEYGLDENSIPEKRRTMKDKLATVTERAGKDDESDIIADYMNGTAQNKKWGSKWLEDNDIAEGTFDYERDMLKLLAGQEDESKEQRKTRLNTLAEMFSTDPTEMSLMLESWNGKDGNYKIDQDDDGVVSFDEAKKYLKSGAGEQGLDLNAGIFDDENLQKAVDGMTDADSERLINAVVNNLVDRTADTLNSNAALLSDSESTATTADILNAAGLATGALENTGALLQTTGFLDQALENGSGGSSDDYEVAKDQYTKALVLSGLINLADQKDDETSKYRLANIYGDMDKFNDLLSTATGNNYIAVGNTAKGDEITQNADNGISYSKGTKYINAKEGESGAAYDTEQTSSSDNFEKLIAQLASGEDLSPGVIKQLVKDLGIDGSVYSQSNDWRDSDKATQTYNSGYALSPVLGGTGKEHTYELTQDDFSEAARLMSSGPY